MEDISIVVRWAHLLLGITWIGMLYYFNFVQGGYFKKYSLKGRISPYTGLVPNTLRWFRWTAMCMFVIAIYLLWSVNSLFNDYIFMTLVMIFFMLINVCFIIWPAQKISLGLKRGDRVLASERAILASRTNNLFCLPIIYCMFASMNKGYMPEHMLLSINASNFNIHLSIALSIALFMVIALEVNVILGRQILKVSMQSVVQSSMALTGVLFFSLAYM